MKHNTTQIQYHGQRHRNDSVSIHIDWFLIFGVDTNVPNSAWECYWKTKLFLGGETSHEQLQQLKLVKIVQTLYFLLSFYIVYWQELSKTVFHKSSTISCKYCHSSFQCRSV